MTDRVDASELSATVPIYEATLKVVPSNLEGVNPNDVLAKDRHLLNLFFDLVDDLTPDITDQVRNNLTSDSDTWNTPLTVNLPRFRLVHKKDLKAVVGKIGLEINAANQGKVDRTDWFCVFNLPPQANQVNQPKLRQTLIDQIRDRMEENEEATGLALSPLNGPDDHRPGQYDEVWAISQKTYPMSQPISPS